MDNLKICRKCGEEKMLVDYYFIKDRGYKSQCKGCEKKYYQENKDEKKQYAQQYYQRNKEKILNVNKHYRRNKYQNDCNYKLANIIRSRLSSALKSKNIEKSNHTFNLIGCSIDELNNWLNFTKPYFIPEDHEGILHIDNFKPLSKFDLNDKQQLKEACNWSNLRYLTNEQNFKKGSHFPSPTDKFKMLILKKLYLNEKL